MTQFNTEVHFADFRKFGSSNISSRTIKADSFNEFKSKLVKICEEKGFTSVTPMIIDDVGDVVFRPGEKSKAVEAVRLPDIEGRKHLWVSEFG